MNLAPLLGSEWIIIVHACAAILAIMLGGLQLALRKGTLTHRVLGRLWVGIMVLVALSSFGIHEFRILGPFSPIHLLSLLVFHSLWQGVRRARKGDISGHKKAMVTLYVLALILTAAFTLLPGRIMYRVFFGS